MRKKEEIKVVNKIMNTESLLNMRVQGGNAKLLPKLNCVLKKLIYLFFDTCQLSNYPF